MDFFAGSGTLGESAALLGRNAVLIDIHPEAIAVMRRRLDCFGPKFIGDTKADEADEAPIAAVESRSECTVAASEAQKSSIEGDAQLNVQHSGLPDKTRPSPGASTPSQKAQATAGRKLQKILFDLDNATTQ